MTLKDIFCLVLIRDIAADLQRAHAPFDTEAFVAHATDGLDALELIARATHIAEALHLHLPRPFANAAAIIEASLGAELPITGEIGRAALHYMPHVFFVQIYGLDDYDAAIRLQAELTRRFTAEFSIRAFLIRYPERTYAQMRLWAADDNAHLRRLASEGIRPRLPWAQRLKSYQKDPVPIIELLERLKDDPVLYVRRSVANNLNDIAKDNPAIVLETCRRWSEDAPPHRAWVIRHALRSLVKAGNQDAIRILGGSEQTATRVTGLGIAPQRIALGETVRFSFEIESTAQQTQSLLIDYAVHYVKANGSTRPKIFKLGARTIEPGEKLVLNAKISVIAMTTRRHFPGRHRLDAIINGNAHPLGDFEIVGDRPAASS